MTQIEQPLPYDWAVNNHNPQLRCVEVYSNEEGASSTVAIIYICDALIESEAIQIGEMIAEHLNQLCGH